MPSIIQHDGYEEYVLSSGENYTHGGNPIQNIHFNCEASGCTLRLNLSGGDVVRHCAVTGKFDTGGNQGAPGTDSGYEYVISAEASSGTIVIEDCYFGDGCEPGIDVSLVQSNGRVHAGHMEVRRCYVAEWNTAALYMAVSAEPGIGEGGTYAVRDSLLRDNNIGSMRIAQEGSVVENCTIYNSGWVPWASFNGTPDSSQDINARCIWSSYGSEDQVVDVINCDIDGRSSQTCPPDYGGNMNNCLASAVVGSGGDSSFHVQDSEVLGSMAGNVTTSNVGSNPDLSAPENCPTTAMEAVGGEVIPTDTLTVSSTDGEVGEYTIEFEGDHAVTGPNANTNPDDEFQDTVTDNGDGTYTIHGFVANQTDDFHVHQEGTFLGGTADSNVAFEINSSSVPRSDIVDDSPDGGGDDSLGDIGGGDGYSDTFSESDGDFVVSNFSEAQDAFSNASAGDVVFLTGDGECEVVDDGNRLVVPSGVTFASNRGVGGASGGLVYTDQSGGDWRFGATGILRVESDARVSGIRVRGTLDQSTDWNAHNYDDEDAGIRCIGSGVEIDNCETWASAVNVYGNDGAHIHHCHVHDANQEGLGYGIHNGGSDSPRPLIEYNLFGDNRHSIADGGGGGYVVRHNVFEPSHISHVIDQHTPGGTDMDVYNNTIESHVHDQNGDMLPGFVVRGVPNDGADLHHNWFHNSSAPLDNPSSGDTDRAIVQIDDESAWTQRESWNNVTFDTNHYGDSDPPEGVGAIAQELTPPGTPTDLTVDATTTTSVDVSWTEPSETGSGIDHYVVYFDGSEYDTVTSTSATVDGLSSETTYTIGVSAVSTDGLESSTANSSATTDAPQPITAPQNLVASDVGVDSVTLSWDPPTNVGPGLDNYTVYLDGVADHTVSSGDTETTISGLTHSTEYDFDVTATDTEGTETDSVSLTETTDTPTPISTPQNLTVTAVTLETIGISWDEPDSVGTGLSSYRVYVGANVDHNVGGVTLATVDDLDPDTEYTVGVSAVDTENNESDVTSTAVTTGSPEEIGSPVDLEVTDRTQSTISLAWVAPGNTGPGIDSYTVYVDGVVFETGIQLRSAEIDGLDAGTEYTIDVTATDIDGNESSSSSITEPTLDEVDAAPHQPQVIALADVAPTSVVLEVTPPNDTGSAPLDHYVVYLDGSEHHIVEAEDSVIAIHGLEPDTEYTIRVSTVNEDGLEGGSLSTTITTEVSGSHSGTPVDPEDPGCGFGDLI